MRVLIVDDEKIRHEEFDKKLGRMFGNNYESAHAYSANDAIKILEEQQTFDVIFLDHDLGLDYKNGKDVSEYLKLHPSKQATDIIIHSGNYSGSMAMQADLPMARYCPLWFAQK
jgi:CheY-like chemotaxis protein